MMMMMMIDDDDDDDDGDDDDGDPYKHRVTPWLTTELKKLARSRDKLKTAGVKYTSSLPMSCFTQM